VVLELSGVAGALGISGGILIGVLLDAWLVSEVAGGKGRVLVKLF